VLALLGGLALAAATAYLIVRFPALHAQYSADLPRIGPQKFHFRPTPRIGGIAVLGGAIAATWGLREQQPAVLELMGPALLCAVFAFGGGLAEDFTKRFPARLRLFLTFVSAAAGFFLLDARISGLQLPWIDWALGFALVSFAFTLFAVGGFAHAMNIVDGFNGLAGVVSLIYLGAIAGIAGKVGDPALMWASLALGAAVLGFLLFNYPKGLIFLGDGGAYLLGFLIAELVVLLVQRNSEVSPWFALALLAYPVVETLFSIYRKRVLCGHSPGDPDGLHLHMLVYKRLVRRNRGMPAGVWTNALTAPVLWTLSLLAAVPAVLFWDHPGLLQCTVLAFASIYIWLYWKIVRFRAPSYLGRFVAGLALSLVLADSALAAGVVQMLRGDVRVARQSVSLNQRLQPGTTITTGARAGVVIRFDDGQQVVLDQNTEFRIVDFHYDPADARMDRSIFDVLKGGLRVVSGAIGRRNPAAFALRSPQASLEIRGTDFMVAIVNAGYVQVLGGAVAVTNHAGTVVFGPGATGTISNSARLPVTIAESALPPDVVAIFSALRDVGLQGAASAAAAGGAANGAGMSTGAGTGIGAGTMLGIALGAAAAAAAGAASGAGSSPQHR
jgi:UDP-N-acetylmuramyl pentapeptide phosphotransferase/UDP-N-acetylglucosamine-1-phosphate transferase